jgi:hypothetical protein
MRVGGAGHLLCLFRRCYPCFTATNFPSTLPFPRSCCRAFCCAFAGSSHIGLLPSRPVHRPADQGSGVPATFRGRGRRHRRVCGRVPRRRPGPHPRPAAHPWRGRRRRATRHGHGAGACACPAIRAGVASLPLPTLSTPPPPPVRTGQPAGPPPTPHTAPPPHAPPRDACPVARRCCCDACGHMFPVSPCHTCCTSAPTARPAPATAPTHLSVVTTATGRTSAMAAAAASGRPTTAAADPLTPTPPVPWTWWRRDCSAVPQEVAPPHKPPPHKPPPHKPATRRRPDPRRGQEAGSCTGLGWRVCRGPTAAPAATAAATALRPVGPTGPPGHSGMCRVGGGVLPLALRCVGGRWVRRECMNEAWSARPPALCSVLVQCNKEFRSQSRLGSRAALAAS